MSHIQALLTAAICVLIVPAYGIEDPCQKRYTGFIKRDRVSLLSRLKLESLHHTNPDTDYILAIHVTEDIGQSRTFTVEGKVQRINLFPDLPLWRVEDQNSGRVIVVEERNIQVYAKDPGVEVPLDSLKKAPKVAAVREDVLRRAWCNLDWSFRKTPEGKFAERLVREKFTAHHFNLPKLQKCLVAMAAGKTITAPFSYVRATDRRNERETWVSEHGSNYFLGLGTMTLFYNCLRAVTKMEQKAALVTTLGLDLAGNVWEEIQIPGLEGVQKGMPIFAASGKPVETDLKDFESGVLGAVTVYALVRASEKLMDFSILASCPK